MNEYNDYDIQQEISNIYADSEYDGEAAYERGYAAGIEDAATDLKKSGINRYTSNDISRIIDEAHTAGTRDASIDAYNLVCSCVRSWRNKNPENAYDYAIKSISELLEHVFRDEMAACLEDLNMEPDDYELMCKSGQCQSGQPHLEHILNEYKGGE